MTSNSTGSLALPRAAVRARHPLVDRYLPVATIVLGLVVIWYIGSVLMNLALVRDGFERKFPWQLSGGMQQRASIARALAFDADLLLMDEPFGALDEITRHKLDADLLRLWREKNLTVVFVTHSIHEAVFLSTRVEMMAARPGRIIEEVRIDEPYPRTADFMVSPQFMKYAKKLQDSLLNASHAEQGDVA